MPLFDKDPSRLQSGVSTAAENNGVMYHWVGPDPTKAYTYFNDFFTYTAADWTITTTEAGAGSATEALTNVAGGNLLITNDDADNDSDEFQLATEPFLMVAGKRTWFEARLKVSDATQSDFLAGLVITDTAMIDGFTDGIAFKKDDGDTNLDFTSLKNSAGSTESAIHTVVADTFMVLGFYYDGSTIHVYVDNAMKGRITSPTIPDDEELAVSFAIQNGEAVAKTMTLDYIFASQER